MRSSRFPGCPKKQLLSRHKLFHNRTRISLVTRLGVFLFAALTRVNTDNNEVLDGLHCPQDLTGFLYAPILVLKCFVRKEQVLSVLHVSERVTRQRVLLIPGRQINAQAMVSIKDS